MVTTNREVFFFASGTIKMQLGNSYIDLRFQSLDIRTGRPLSLGSKLGHCMEASTSVTLQNVGKNRPRQTFSGVRHHSISNSAKLSLFFPSRGNAFLSFKMGFMSFWFN